MPEKLHLPPENTIDNYIDELKIIGLSQEQIAEKLGISQPTVSRLFEHGVELSYELAYKIVHLIQERSSTLPNESVSKFAIKSDQIVSVDLDDSIADVVTKMGNSYTQLPVFDEEKNCSGIVTDWCLLERMMAILESESKADWLSRLRVIKIKNADVVELVPSYPDDTPIGEVAEGLLHHYAVLIEEKEGGTGIITRTDLVKLLL
jgi:predicted transcriptional regulator